MNRQIKFRVWNTKTKSFLDLKKLNSQYESYLFHQDDDGLKLFGPGGYEIPDILIDQYTGAKDRFENEIYENDIIRDEFPYYSTPRNNLVRWYSTADNYGIDGWYGIPVREHRRPYNVQGVIIGNIHQNPELI